MITTTKFEGKSNGVYTGLRSLTASRLVPLGLLFFWSIIMAEAANKPTRYTKIHWQYNMEHSKLTAFEISLLTILWLRSNNHNIVTSTYEQLMAASGIKTRNALSNTLKMLEQKGIIKRKKIRKKNSPRFLPTHYILLTNQTLFLKLLSTHFHTPASY